jgi:DNA-binding transcriptional MocR family regulator
VNSASFNSIAQSRETAGPGWLYERVAQQIRRLIEEGTLRPGERIPSVRKLVSQQSVSAATVLQAYQLLESRGWIEARPQSGFYVRARRRLQPPQPAVSQPPTGSRQLNMAGLVMEVVGALSQPGLVNLGAAVPPPELLPTRELHRALASAARRQPVLANTCDPGRGLLSLRVEIARQAMEAGCSLSPDDIIVMNGTTEALHLCLRAVTCPGDTVAVESPTYFGILQVIVMLGLRVCVVPTSSEEGVCVEELAARLTRARVKACVFMPNYSNPLGSCMPEENKRKLVELLAERGIPLIEDDIYGSLAFGPNRPHAAKAFDTQGLVQLCGSLTKTLAPGYRIGWAAPGRFAEDVHRLKHTSSLGNPTVTQLAAAEFLATGGYDRHLRHLRRAYAALMEQMSQSVARHFPPATRLSRPQGGQVLWVELPEGIEALSLHRLALASGISIAPGPIFSPRQQNTNCFRLNFANPWSDKIEEAVATLARIVAGGSCAAKLRGTGRAFRNPARRHAGRSEVAGSGRKRPTGSP